MSASKTPYEIRLNILELAYKIVRDKKQADYISKSIYSSGNVVITECIDISADEVIEVAKKLNSFISTSEKRLNG